MRSQICFPNEYWPRMTSYISHKQETETNWDTRWFYSILWKKDLKAAVSDCPSRSFKIDLEWLKETSEKWEPCERWWTVLRVTGVWKWFPSKQVVATLGCVCGGGEGRLLCRDPTAAALIRAAIKSSAEVNLFPLRSAQYSIDLGGSTARQTCALISDSLHLIGTWQRSSLAYGTTFQALPFLQPSTWSD